MKLIMKYTLVTLFFLLLAVNIYIFVSGIKLSDKINQYEGQISQLTNENLDLENQTYEVDSLQFASSMAAKFKFDQKAQPIYFENLNYALRPQL